MFTAIQQATRIAAIGLFVTTAAASAGLAQGLLEDCATDIVTYCENVEPGDGRVISCLYAYEDKISEACYAATLDFHDAMDFMFGTVREAIATWASDIESFCANTDYGHGQMLTCLSENKPAISAECKQIVDGFEMGLAAE